MKFTFLFLDGVGLGKDDPNINPFVRAPLPNLDLILEGNKIIAWGQSNDSNSKQQIFHTEHASFLALDACLGIDGTPQSASGQASLLTGKNVSAILGFHDGPKPNPEIMNILKAGTLFSWVNQDDGKATLLNAYPPRYFKSIETGYRLPGVIALSAKYAEMKLKTMDDLFQGAAISTDFTAKGWHDLLGLKDTPLLTPSQAGERIRKLSSGYELAFFEYWLTDIAGHRQDMQAACELLAAFDTVLGSLIQSWDDDNRLILITSDHGNLEDLSARSHTRNYVPLLLIGSHELRERFISKLLQAKGKKESLSITNVSPTIISLIDNLK
jgi:2,3-bisphosphoglycerate-independent phosphoglycerate mutase